MRLQNTILEINLLGLIKIIAGFGAGNRINFRTERMEGGNVEDAQRCERRLVEDALSGHVLEIKSSFSRNNHIGLIISTDLESFSEFVRLIENNSWSFYPKNKKE